MCALVGTRAVPYIGWTEQLRRREHFAGAPCNIRVLLRRQLQAMQRFVHMAKALQHREPCLFCGRTFARISTNLHTHTHTHNLQRLPQQPETTSWPISSNSPGCPGAELEAALHENGSECDVAKNGSRECATRVVKGVRDQCRGGVPGEGVQLGVCGLWVGV